MPDLIGQVVIQPPAPRPGEPVLVQVLDADGHPFADGGPALFIGGVPGGRQYLQFPTTGERRLRVRAVAAGGKSESRVATLEVQGEPLRFTSADRRRDLPMLKVSQAQAQPYQAVLTLGSFIDTRSPALLSLAPTVSPRLAEHLSPRQLAARFSGRGALHQALAGNARTATRVDTRRLSGARRAAARRGEVPRAARQMAAAVYDLSHVDLGALLGPAGTVREQRYEWDFGDGETAVTTSPSAAHDYFASLDHAAGFGQFVVTCRAVHDNLTVRRTLTVYSGYALCKRSGTVVPHVTADIFAHKQYTRLGGTFSVSNVEDEPLVLDRMSVTAISADGDSLALPSAFVPLERPITVAPRSTSTLGVSIPFVEGTPETGQLHYDVPGFTVRYAGQVGDLPVSCAATFDVPVAEWDLKPSFPVFQVPDLSRDPWPWELVEDLLARVANPADPVVRPDDVILDRQTGTVAVSLGALGVERASRKARERAARVLSSVYAPVAGEGLAAGRLALPRVQTLMRTVRGPLRDAPRLGTAWLVTHGVLGQSSQFLSGELGPPQPGPIAEGQICDPENLTEEDLAQADAGQLVCQLTDEVKEVRMPARWMNARKGDVILSPGGDGIIGGLMLNVNPPQWYSHSGIMTRNHDEITHSTGSQKRLLDHQVGWVDGSDGFEPKVLKYMWPGAITQSVECSVVGEDFPDPEYDKTYSVSAFGPHTVGITHNDRMVMIPPLVLKPRPDLETPAVRGALHAIASAARAAGGRPGVTSKYHYRFYCYTDPTIGQGAPEGPEAGWAAGTRPSVCSSFIWLKAKEQGAHLETDQALVMPTDLEPGDIEHGAVVRPTTPDGLYTYSAEERLNAARWLYDTIYNQAYDKAGWFGNFLTDAADDVANQFLNVFANDDADGKDSTEWENAAPADAVSPDNLLWWDGPDLGGLYGFTEPALYREPRVESYTVSKWKRVLSRGALHVRVLGEGGQPEPQVLTQVYESKSGFTGADGRVTLPDVPLGIYLLKASKVKDGVLHSAQVSVNLDAADVSVDVSLQPPADRFRLAQVFIDFWGRDDEWGDDEFLDPGPESFELDLGPDKLINSTHRTYKWGGELRVEYDITVRLLVNNTIDVAVQGTLYEGTDEDTDDLDGQGGVTFQVAVGQTAGATLTITNTDEDDPDAGVLSISVNNARNTN